MGAKLFEEALGIAGDAEGLDGFVGLEKFSDAENFGGFSGTGHEDDLFSADLAESLTGSEEQFRGGHAGGGDVEMLGPDGSDDAGQVVTGATSDEKPGTARGKGLGETVEDAGFSELGFSFSPNVRLGGNFGESVLRRAGFGRTRGCVWLRTALQGKCAPVY